MNERVYLTADRDGWTDGIQISIGVEDEDGSGHGFRIAGPKYNGSSVTLKKCFLGEHEAEEIRSYLDRIAPPKSRPLEDDLTARCERLREALNDYRSAFGQALDCHGIPYGPQQEAAEKKALAALSEGDG